MSLQDRIEALKENKRPLPNRDAIYDLKRQKLRIKDEIYQLEKH